MDNCLMTVMLFMCDWAHVISRDMRKCPPGEVKGKGLQNL